MIRHPRWSLPSMSAASSATFACRVLFIWLMVIGFDFEINTSERVCVTAKILFVSRPVLTRTGPRHMLLFLSPSPLSNLTLLFINTHSFHIG